MKEPIGRSIRDNVVGVRYVILLEIVTVAPVIATPLKI